MKELEKMMEKLKGRIPTKFIKDLEIMEEFNGASNPIEQDKILGQFFDELIRMLIEFKMAFEDPLDFMAANNRLNHYLKKTVEILQFNYNNAMIWKKSILRANIQYESME